MTLLPYAVRDKTILTHGVSQKHRFGRNPRDHLDRGCPTQLSWQATNGSIMATMVLTPSPPALIKWFWLPQHEAPWVRSLGQLNGVSYTGSSSHSVSAKRLNAVATMI